MERWHKKWRIPLKLYGGSHASHDAPRGCGRPNTVYLPDFPGDRHRDGHDTTVGARGRRGGAGGAHRRRGDHQHQEVSVHRMRATRPSLSRTQPLNLSPFKGIGIVPLTRTCVTSLTSKNVKVTRGVLCKIGGVLSNMRSRHGGIFRDSTRTEREFINFF